MHMGKPTRAIIVLVVVALIVVADWYERNREMDSLLDAVETSEAAMEAFQAEQLEILTSATRGDHCADTPMTVECQQAAEALRIDLSDAAADGVVDIQIAGADVRDVRILPWHSALRSARRTYGEHNGTWVRHLDAATSNPAALWDKATWADINATFLTSHARFQDGLTLLPLFDAPSRIDQVWADVDE